MTVAPPPQHPRSLLAALRAEGIDAQEPRYPAETAEAPQLLALTGRGRADAAETTRLQELLARRPDAVVLHTGLPEHLPPAERTVVTLGAGPVPLRAAVRRASARYPAATSPSRSSSTSRWRETVAASPRMTGPVRAASPEVSALSSAARSSGAIISAAVPCGSASASPSGPVAGPCPGRATSAAARACTESLTRVTRWLAPCASAAW